MPLLLVAMVMVAGAVVAVGRTLGSASRLVVMVDVPKPRRQGRAYSAPCLPARPAVRRGGALGVVEGRVLLLLGGARVSPLPLLAPALPRARAPLSHAPLAFSMLSWKRRAVVMPSMRLILASS